MDKARDGAAAAKTVPVSFWQEDCVNAAWNGVSNFNVALCFTVSGCWSPGPLVEAFSGLAARHEALRTAFSAQDGGVVGVVAPAASVDVPLTDLSRSPASAGDMEAIAREDVARPFELTEGPLWRARLMRLGHDRVGVGFVLSHSICDGWSTAVAYRDLGRLYEGALWGRPPRLKPLTWQFGDYAAEERSVRDAELEEAWRRHLSSRPAAPVAGPEGSSTRAGGIEMVSRPFRAAEPAVAQRLRALGRSCGGTTATAVYTGVVASLARDRGNQLVLGLLYANRERPEVQGVMGPVFDYLPVQLDLRGDPTVAELAGRVGAEFKAARARQLPLGRIERAVRGDARQRGGPLFDVTLNFMRHWRAPVRVIPTPDGGRSELAMQPLEDARLRFAMAREFASAVKLSYVVRQREDGGLDGWIYANERALPWETMGRLGDELARTLQLIADDAGQRVSALAE